MKTYRIHAVMAGVLYVLGTVGGILSIVVVGGFPDEDFLTRIAGDPSRLTLGAFFILMAPGLGFLQVPLAVQEMVMGAWLIVKGFSPAAIASLPAQPAPDGLLPAA